MTVLTSALHWWPILSETRLPLPRTEFVPYDHRQMMEYLEPGSDGPPDGDYPRDVARAVGKAMKVVGIPAFVRTDLSSAKHDGPKSYRVMAPTDLLPVVTATVADNEMKFWLEPDRTPQAFMVREWLELAGGFRAFGWDDAEGHLIAREFRFFASDGVVDCWHPYWPVHAIEDHHPNREDWRESLAKNSALEGFEREYLERLAREATAALGGSWSVDFAFDVNGKWWLIDLAVAHESWHEHDEVVA